MDQKWTLSEVPLRSGKIIVPGEISLENGHLVWYLAKLRARNPGVGMLQGFQQLFTAGDDDILKYARLWGVFGFCPTHELPASHSAKCDWIPHPSGVGFSENLEVWRHYSRAVFALTHIAAYLAHNEVVNSEKEYSDDTGVKFNYWDAAMTFTNIRPVGGGVIDWAALDIVHSGGIKRQPSHKSMLRISWSLVHREIDSWLELGKVRPRLRREGETTVIELDSHAYPKLFGMLALKLMHAVSGKEAAVICSTCPDAYYPKRGPSPGRGNYCPKCRSNGNKWKVQKRRQRDRRPETP